MKPTEPPSGPARPGRLLPRIAVHLSLLAATLAVTWILFTQDAIPRGDDVFFHSKCAAGFADGLRDGIVYPSWASEVNRGFGAPVYLFYPPLGYYLLGGAILLFGDVLEGLRVMPVPVLYLSGVAFWLATRRRLGASGAAMGGVLYVLLPYHVIDLLWRYAWAEFVAFLWLPALFMSCRDLTRRFSWGAWFELTLASVGLLLTHVATATLLPFVLGPWVLAHMLKTRHWKSVLPMVGAGVLALACAAVYLVPLLSHRDEVHLEWAFDEWFDWRRNFIFRDETTLGFEADETKPVVERAVVTQALLAAGAGLLLAWQQLRARRRSGAPAAGRQRHQPGVTFFDGWLLLGLAAWTILLQTPAASILWRELPLLETVQFPWRFGSFQVIVTALLCAVAMAPQRAGQGDAAESGQHLSGHPGRMRVRVAILSAAALPALWASYTMIPKTVSFDHESMAGREYRAEVVREYIPLPVEGWQWLWRDRSHPRVVASTGRAEVLSWTSHERRLRIDSDSGTLIGLRTFAFPGWEASLDGEPAELYEHWRVALAVPPGSHEIEVRFRPTRARRLGASLSAVGVLGLVLVLLVARRRRTS